MLAVVKEQLNLVRAGGSHATARTVGFLCQVALKGFELSKLADQIREMRERLGMDES